MIRFDFLIHSYHHSINAQFTTLLIIEEKRFKARHISLSLHLCNMQQHLLRTLSRLRRKEGSYITSIGYP